MKALLPGATIGIVGGGQLARMMALEARRMGFRVAVVAQDPQGPAALVSDHCIEGALDDEAALDALAQCSDVVTLDSEHVSVRALDRIEQSVPVRPSPSVLRTIQDRLTQRQFLAGCGAPQVRHAEVSHVAELENALQRIGRPAVLKTRRAGYDGRGQLRIDEGTSAKEAFEALDGVPCVLEEFIRFDREISVLLARSVSGEIRFFPLAENEHRDHVLHLTLAPAPASEGLQRRAQEVSANIAKALDHVGMLAVELFVTGEEILVNELAPRPHNSGHFTFGACATSQFEQHVRAVTGLSLGDPLLARPTVMVNLLGDLWAKQEPDWSQVLSAPDAHLHLYGKRQARPGRKMGHFLVLGNDTAAARKRGEHLHALLSADPR